jgi:hypothetical protein
MTISRHFDQSATILLMVLPVMRAAAVMIAKILCTYTMRNLRQEQSLRDHGAGVSRQCAAGVSVGRGMRL